MFETTAIFPAGEYVIIDPCYVLHDEWSEICNDFFFVDNPNGCNEGVFTLKDGRRIFVGNTKYGDGTYSLRGYKGDQKALIGVDAGCIGLVRLRDIDQSNPQNDIRLGYVIECNSAFTVSVKDGYFEFGGYTIDTDDEDEEEDDHDYYMDDYESNFEQDY